VGEDAKDTGGAIETSHGAGRDVRSLRLCDACARCVAMAR
jgi:predicted small secreted protein